MSPITINTDGISDEQKKSPKFRFVHDGMLADLSAPGFIDVLCAHEAAHKLYLEMNGVTKFAYLPAKISYDPATDTFVGDLAAVQPTESSQPDPTKLKDWCAMRALAYAAGGVVSRKLMPSLPDFGDTSDKEQLNVFCAQINAHGGYSADLDVMWKWAQETVAKMLEETEFFAAIKEEAIKIKPLLGF